MRPLLETLFKPRDGGCADLPLHVTKPPSPAVTELTPSYLLHLLNLLMPQNIRSDIDQLFPYNDS